VAPYMMSTGMPYGSRKASARFGWTNVVPAVIARRLASFSGGTSELNRLQKAAGGRLAAFGSCSQTAATQPSTENRGNSTKGRASARFCRILQSPPQVVDVCSRW
jgi:hypothetical protein